MDRSISQPELARQSDPRNENPDYENFNPPDRYGRPQQPHQLPQHNYMNHSELKNQGWREGGGPMYRPPAEATPTYPKPEDPDHSRVREWQQRNEVAEQSDRRMNPRLSAGPPEDVPRSQAQYQPQQYYQGMGPRGEDSIHEPPGRGEDNRPRPSAAPRQMEPQKPQNGRSAQEQLRPQYPKYSSASPQPQSQPQQPIYKPANQQQMPPPQSTKYQIGPDGRPLYDRPVPAPRPSQSPQSPELPPPPPPESPPALPPPPAELQGYQDDLPPPPSGGHPDYEQQIKEEQERMARRMAGLPTKQPEQHNRGYPDNRMQQQQQQPPHSGYGGSHRNSQPQDTFQDYQNIPSSSSSMRKPEHGHPLYSQAGPGHNPFGAMDSNEGRYDPLSRAQPAQPQVYQPQKQMDGKGPSGPGPQQPQQQPPQPQKKVPPPVLIKPKPPPVAAKPVLAVKRESRGSSPSPSPWEREQKERDSKQREEDLRRSRDSEIADLEGRLRYLNPEEQERLRKLRVDQEFDRRAQEAMADEADSDSDMTDRAGGRARMLKILQDDIERRRQQIAEERSLQQQRESLAEVEKNERYGLDPD